MLGKLLTLPRVLVQPAVPEFRALVGKKAVEELEGSLGDVVQTSQVLKKCFARMMTCEKKVFVDQLNMLVKRVTEEGEQHKHSRHDTDWLTFVCLHKAYTNSWCRVTGPGFGIIQQTEHRRDAWRPLLTACLLDALYLSFFILQARLKRTCLAATAPYCSASTRSILETLAASPSTS